MTQQADEYFKKRLELGWAEGLAVELSNESHSLYAFQGGCTTATVDEQEKSIDAESRFNVGSVTKTVVAALVCKLAEGGHLSLSDKVKRYIPEYTHEAVSIQHLLEHTAGYASEQVFNSADYSSTQDYLRAVYETGILVRPVHEQSAYFSPGYTVLCDVMERVTGLSLQTFADATLFGPLGMTSTSFESAQVPHEHMILPRLADGRAQRELITVYPLGEGVLFSCTADLLKFGRLFLNGGMHDGKAIFHERTIPMMMQESTHGKFDRTPVFWRKGAYDRYGCFGELHSPQAVGHTGYSGCMLWIDPTYQLTAALLSNSTQLHGYWSNYQKMSNVLLAL